MSEPFSLESRTLEQTYAIGAAVARECGPSDVVALSGELGAGKTQFVRGMARGLGIDERKVSSPTFVIAHEYESDDGRRVLVHLDAYRLGGREDLAALGFADDEGGDLRGGAVMAVEWASRVEGALPGDRLEVLIEHLGEGRRLTFVGRGAWAGRMIPLEAELRATGES